MPAPMPRLPPVTRAHLPKTKPDRSMQVLHGSSSLLLSPIGREVGAGSTFLQPEVRFVFKPMDAAVRASKSCSVPGSDSADCRRFCLHSSCPERADSPE